MTKKRAIHKSDYSVNAQDQTRCERYWIYDVERREAWEKVTCKKCLKKKGNIPKQHKVFIYNE